MTYLIPLNRHWTQRHWVAESKYGNTSKILKEGDKKKQVTAHKHEEP